MNKYHLSCNQDVSSRKIYCKLTRTWGQTKFTGTRPRITPYNGHSEGAGDFFRLELYKRIGISRIEAWKRAAKTDISVFKRVFPAKFLKAPS